MTTKAELENAMKEALRLGDDVRKRTLRMAVSAIRLAEIDKGSPLDEPTLLAILQKEVKSRQEAMAEAEQANRPDLIEEALEEIAVLEEFLPSQFSAEELENLARQVIAEVGASSPKEMGQVMKVLIPRLQGRASGSDASQVVRKLLES
jgi:uncharacterized protein YqeY